MHSECELWTSWDAWIPLVHNIDNNFFFLGEIVEKQKRVNTLQVTYLRDKKSTIAQQAETIKNLNEVIAQLRFCYSITETQLNQCENLHNFDVMWQTPVFIKN